MAHGTQDSDDIISGINVTPLVDIVLVILIIFIVTASFVFKPAIEMKLPEAQTGEQAAAGLLNLAISPEGELYINGTASSVDQIPKAVDEARARLAEQDGGQKVSAFVAADVKTQYGAFAGVVDRLRLAGVTEIALDTQPVELSEVR